MNERIIEITDMQVHLSVDRGFMLAKVKDGGESRIPIDEIGGVIANSYQLTYSNNLLVRLAENNIPLVVCGKNHNPKAFLWSTESHSTLAGRIDSQIRVTAALSKRLWQCIIQAKVQNQVIILKALGKQYVKVEALLPKILSGDTSNIEGQAARIYWKELMGETFIRDRTLMDANALLNYGYMIMRSGVARAIMGAGLHPAIAVFHKNAGNPYRLVDDLIEPFRQVIDYNVYKLINKGETDLTAEAKTALVSTLYMDLDSERGRTPIINKMHNLAKSYAKSLESVKILLELPIIKIEDLE